MAGRRRKCCTIGIFKYLFHVFNIIFLLTGLGVLAVGVWSIFWRYHFVQIQVTFTYAIIIYTLLVVGILITIVNIIGYIGVWKENRCTILYYTFLLLIILLIEVAVGLLSYLYQKQMPEELESHLKATFVNSYEVDEKQTEAIDYIQKRLRCCGAVRFEDWTASRWYSLNKNRTLTVPEFCARKHNVAARVPESCCKSPSLNCGCSDHPNNIYYNGCIHRLKREILLHLYVIQYVAFFIAGLQFFGILLSYILCMKKEDGTAVYKQLSNCLSECLMEKYEEVKKKQQQQNDY